MRCLALLFTLLLAPLSPAAPDRPNIIYILSDDLAQGDLGAYGQKLIRTPSLDRMASEGTRFTQAYCGTSVCAPSRASLMTGLHSGHCPIRANREIQPEGQKPLPQGTVTVASLLKQAGYATACIRKWGMGMLEPSGSPLTHGFDHFFGYNCQRHAHSYFPKYLYNDDQRIPLEGNDGKSIGKVYAQDLIADDSLRWIRSVKDKPFFLFYAITLPHGRHEIDDLGPYADKPWSPQQKAYAAQVTRLDSDIGRVLELLKELGLDQNTLVITTGDNGSSFAPSSEIGKLFDQASNGLRGYKRSLYEGALRQAAIARWPGTIPSGRVASGPWAFWDFLGLPEGFTPDGISLVPYLKGGDAPNRPGFYWELHEGKPQQAARIGDWKAVKPSPDAPIELFNLASDPAESNNIAGSHPDKVEQFTVFMARSHTKHPDWPLDARTQKKTASK